MLQCAEELNLSSQSLKKLTKATSDESRVTKSLILDNNELQKLDNIDSYIKMERLSAKHNQLMRMYGVCRLSNLRVLDLSYNGILTIEGLRDLVHLTYLNLSYNKVKTIEHLQSNVNLEFLDLSHNAILSIGDISHVKNLQQLYLHGNKIVHLRQCDKYLPLSITTLTLANNSLGDLNEISNLVMLNNLVEITIEGNPCVSMSGGSIGFDYRPFIINWITSLKVIDGYMVTPIESLKAEWLYSQGRGRQFAIGEQQSLCRYLAATCPITEQALETEDNRKLRLILSKAQQHQQQLMKEQMSNSTGSISIYSSPGSSRRRNKIGSPHLSQASSIMTNSYHDSNSADNKILANIIHTNNIMTQSLDSALNLTNANITVPEPEKIKHTSQSVASNHNHETVTDFSSPLHAAKKLVPVPESLMSPDVHPDTNLKNPTNHQNSVQVSISNIITKSSIPKTTNSPKCSPKVIRSNKFQLNKTAAQSNNKVITSPSRQRKTKNPSIANNVETTPPDKLNSEEDQSIINTDKLQGIKRKAKLIQQKQNQMNEVPINTTHKVNSENLHQYATTIQKLWRGYRIRNSDKARKVAHKINEARMSDYIKQLSTDMAATKSALESEKKIQHLQMQAISALWKKVSHISSGSGDGNGSLSNSNNHQSSQATSQVDNQQILMSNKSIKDLEITCSHLQQQVKELQNSMTEVMNYMGKLCQTMPGCFTKSPNTENISTQTDVTAVYTPQDEQFPFGYKISRPSSLPLPKSQYTQTVDFVNTCVENLSSTCEIDKTQDQSEEN